MHVSDGANKSAGDSIDVTEAPGSHTEISVELTPEDREFLAAEQKPAEEGCWCSLII